VKLNFQGQAGMDYSVLYSTNLINWMPLGVAVSGPAGQFMLMVTNKPAPSAVFFRLAGQVSSMPVVTAFSHVLDTTYIGFGGKTGHSYSVLSSTNLVDWSDEGVATEFEPGIFAYLFKGDTNHPTRFYRLRSP
jgi:hypothetical protein